MKIVSLSSPSQTRPPRVRSAVSNGRRKFVEASGRTAWARRHSDLVALYCEDMGGSATLSRAQVALAERASTLEVELQAMEGRLSEGDRTVDLDLFVRAVGALNRTLKTIGVQRVARDATPSLHAYILAHAERGAAE